MRTRGGRGLSARMRAEWARVRAVRAAQARWQCCVVVLGAATRPGVMSEIRSREVSGETDHE